MNNGSKSTQIYMINPAKEKTNYIHGEVNLEKLPIFAPDKRKNFGKNGLTYTYTKGIFKDGQYIELKWEVAAHSKYGSFLNHFDRDVYRCIQKIITERGLLNNGYVKFSTYEIIVMLDRQKTGSAYKQVKNSLRKMTAAIIQSSGIFYDKKSKKTLTDCFHLFDRFIQKGEDLSDGSVAETNYIKLSEPLLKSIQAGYLKPVNFEYYMHLKTSLAKTLYSRLSTDFYGLPNNVPFLKKRYSILCEETIITRQKYPSYAKRSLASTFDELINTGFLSKVEFEAISNDKKDFFIKFYPGKLAREPDKFKEIYSTSEVFESSSRQKLLTSIDQPIEDDLLEEDKFILQHLLDIHVSKPAAKECLNDYKEKTKYWLEAKKVDDKYAAATNKAGFIVMAIKRNWSSANYEKFLVKEKQQMDLQAKCLDIENRQKELDCLKEKNKLEAFYCKLSDSEQKEIELNILERLKQENSYLYQQYKKKGLSVGIEATLNSYRYEILKSLKSV